MKPAMKDTTNRKDGGNDYWDDSGFGRKISDNKMSDKQVSDLISNLIRRINRRKQATNEDLKSEVSRWWVFALIEQTSKKLKISAFL